MFILRCETHVVFNKRDPNAGNSQHHHISQQEEEGECCSVSIIEPLLLRGGCG